MKDMMKEEGVVSQFENKYLATAQRHNVWLWHATSLRRCAAARIQTATLPGIYIPLFSSNIA